MAEFSKRVENNKGKGEIAPFPAVFTKDLYCRHVKPRLVWENVKHVLGLVLKVLKIFFFLN